MKVQRVWKEQWTRMNELMITKLNPDTGRERSANTGFMEDKVDPNSL